MWRMRFRRKFHILLIAALALMLWAFPMGVFAASGSAEVSIQVEKEIAGDEPAADETFTFLLTPMSSANPMPADRGVLNIRGEGKGQFGAMTYTRPGEYVYTVQEKAQSISGYSFDSTVYRVSVKVLYDGGGLRSEVTVQKEGASAKSDAIVFTNEYDREKDPTAPDDPGNSHHPSPPDDQKGPDQPGKADGNGQSEQAKTGDESNLNFWLILMAASGAGLLIVGGLGVRKRKAK